MAAERQNAAATAGRKEAPPAHRGSPPRRPTPLRAQLRFEHLPVAWCHPGRIGALMPEGLPVAFRDRLQASKRLRLRLSDLIAERFRLEPCTLDDLATPEGRFVQLEGEDLENAVRRIGAIWHARKIKRIILKDRLRELIERLGRDNHRAALRFVDLAPKDDDLEHAGTTRIDEEAPDLDRLLGQIERDGMIALNAWCRHQPACLGERLRLKLPPCPEVDDAPPASHQDRGLMIVDHVVTTLTSENPLRADRHG